jgi:hypothetical protein
MMEQLTQKKPNLDLLPGGFESDMAINLDPPTYIKSLKIQPGIYEFNNALTCDDVDKLISVMNSSTNFSSVTIQGRKDIIDDRIGSVRTSIWSEQIANEIWKKIKGIIPNRTFNEYSRTDWWQHEVKTSIWKPIGFSPLLRFMKYKTNGQHYAHYDAGFIYPDPSIRTLMSVVIYLTTNEKGGSTRFINDKQNHICEYNRNHNDWDRETRDDEVFYKVQPLKGKILLFDHRICHDVEKYLGTERIIIRGDIIFKAI